MRIRLFLKSARLAPFFFVFLLAGCGTQMQPNFSKMSLGYAQYLAQYQTNSILANVVRASEERPLSFLDIPSINGSGNINQTHSMALSFGGAVAGNLAGSLVTANPTATIDFGSSFTFQQASLDNAVFWRGFLTEIPVKIGGMFRTRRIPRELLFSLMVESIDVISPDQKVTRFYNSPLDPEFSKFNTLLYELMGDGLDLVPVRLAEASAGVLETAAVTLADEYRWCLKVDGSNSAPRTRFHVDQYCSVRPEDVALFTGRSRIAVHMRSLKTVFNYLGEVMTLQLKTPSVSVDLQPTAETKNYKYDQANRYKLLVVVKNPPITTPSFASAAGGYGDEYAIPREDNGYSPLVIDILSNLLTLNKIAGSFPQQPGVLIR